MRRRRNETSLATAAARRLPAGLRRGARRAVYSLDGLSRARARLGGERRPIPPRLLRERIGATSIASYFSAGEQWGASIERGLEQAGAGLGGADVVLDFGCGAGKVLQYLAPRYPELSWLGCDQHPASVSWVDRELPVTAVANGYEPPLPFETDSIGCAYLCSVFTHLNQAQQLLWLEEVARVIRPGGSVAISIHGETSRAVGSAGAPDPTTIRGQGFVFEPYAATGASYAEFAGTSREYGLTFQSHEWTRAHWYGPIEIESILPQGLAGHQDLVIGRVPGHSAT